jgi:GWxTD domain-containing protein
MSRFVRAAMLVPLLMSGIGIAGSARAEAQVNPASQTVRPTAEVSVARFWRGEGVTAFEGVVSVPLGGGNADIPVVALSIKDSSGQVLHSESWTDSVSQELMQMAGRRQDVLISTPIRVNVRPGTYVVAARVARGTGVDSAQLPVASFAEAPVASDLIVSNGIRALAPADQVSGAEVRIGQFGIVRTAVPSVEPANAVLWYYLELYRQPGADSTAALEVTVVRASGGEPLLRVPRTVRLRERGGSDVARLPLTGLPPGQYVLHVKATIGSRTEQREASFAMLSFETQPVPVVAPPSGGSGEQQLYARYFAPEVRSDSAIAQIVDALTVVSLAEPLPAFAATADPDTKRRVLARYFARLADPTPVTPEHELFEEYARRAEYASREFAERDLRRSGLRTERGRVYLKYGPPDAKQLIPLGSASRGAVEVWRYSKQRGIKYAFLDETGFQHFTMIYTTDPNMQSLPDWQTRVGDREIVSTIISF